MSASKGNLLIVEDDDAYSDALCGILGDRGFITSSASSIKDAASITQDFIPDYALVDLRLGNDSGLEAIPLLKQTNPNVVIVVLTGYASIATAVEAIKLGAIQYLTKPASSDEIYQAFFKTAGDTQQKLQENPMSVKRMEWEHIQKVLNEHDGNLSATARALGMHRRTLQRKLNKYPVKS